MSQSQASRLSFVSAALLISAACFAVFGQYQYAVLQNNHAGQIFAGIAAVQWIIALLQPDVRARLRASSARSPDPPEAFRWSSRRLGLMAAGVVWMALVFRMAWNGTFDLPLLICWGMGVAYWWLVLTEADSRRRGLPAVSVPINASAGLFVLFLLVGAFSLYYRLDEAPAGMVADHVEKVYDLIRINEGLYPTYFGANSGREPLHFYLSYAFTRTFSYSFLSLKHASALIALLSLPALYWLGRQIDGQLTGLLAMGIGAACAWQMVIGRSGFRAIEASLAAAVFLAFFWRALYSGRRLEFLLTGLALGAGQYTYTAFRIAPLVLLAGLGLRWLVTPPQQRRDLLANFAAGTLVAAMVYIPLFSFWMRYPKIYWYRSQALVGDGWLDNLRAFGESFWQSVTLFNYTRDPVSLNSIPGWPALGPVSAALFALGLSYWLWRVYNNRRWLELLLPLTLIIFVLPSALAISTPLEMPSTRRAIAALPAALALAGAALRFIADEVRLASPTWLWSPIAAIGCASLLVVHAAWNWDGYFNEFTPLRTRATITQIAAAEQILQMERQGGSIWSAYLLYENDMIWIDPRMVAIWLNHPSDWHNIILNPDPDLCSVEQRAGEPLLVIYDLAQRYAERWLVKCFPDHIIYEYRLGFNERLFNVFYVPARDN